MKKIKIDNDVSPYPMPMVLIGAMVDGQPNFMAAAWVSRVNYKPVLFGVTIDSSHHTHAGIQAHGQFSVNVPGSDLIAATDYCGLVSGTKVDKSKCFETFAGELEFAPMVTKCPLTMECRVVQSVSLYSDTLFIGEVVSAYSEEQYLTDGKPDVQKIKPFVLTMPDNNYWWIGGLAGKAWGIGKNFKP